MTAVSTAKRPLIIASIMAAMAMIALEATIVSTAMPKIVADLGGLHLYGWAFSSFLLTQTATTVVFGKLSDLYGRKPILLVGIAVFLVGSILCGFAWSMPSLIAFRLLQGVGAGAIQPVGMTVVGDLYTAQERGRVQGYLASVWAISAVLGPLAGGFIIRNFSWPWIFWINIPIGIAAAAGFVAFLHENVTAARRTIDVAGAALFLAVVAALMVALTAYGTGDTDTTLVSSGICVVALALFVWQERRAPEPMLDFALWSRRPIAAANGASLLAGMALIGLTTFLPMYVQGVLHQSALVAGFALTAMVLGWPFGATTAAKVLIRFGLRPVLLVGGSLLPVGAIPFLLLGSDTSPVVAGIGSLVMGFGMGLLSTASLVLIQEITAWSERGSATASNIFARNLGSTLGATVLGAVLNTGLAHNATGTPVTSETLRPLLQGEAAGASAALEAIRFTLQHALHLTFWAVFAISAATLLVTVLVPRVAIRTSPERIEPQAVME